MQNTILRLPAVIARTGHPKSTIYAKIAAGEFPQSIKIGARASGWIEAEINAYVARRIEASRDREVAA